MNKKKLLSIFLFVVTLLLLVTTFYLNSLLQGGQKDSVTQIKKTKASAQTYHRYLALNITLPTNSSRSSQSSSINPSPTDTLLSVTPRLTTQPTQQLGQKNNSSNSSSRLSSGAPSPSVSLSITPVPSGLLRTTPTTNLFQSSISKSSSSISSGLLAYRNPTTMSSVSTSSTRNTSSSINSSIKLTISPSVSKRLPETGAVQYSSILFIVAVTTIFIAFLY